MDSQRKRHATDDLRSTSEAIAADAQRVAEIERQKSNLEPGNPRLKTLAEESERLTAGMAGKAKMESALRREAEREPRN